MEYKIRPKSEEWVKLVKSIPLTASQFSDVVGIEGRQPFMFLQTCVEKKGDVNEETDSESDRVKEQHKEKTEMVIKEAYELLTGHRVQETGFWVPDKEDGMHGLVGALPDGVVNNSSDDSCILGLVNFKNQGQDLHTSNNSRLGGIARHHMVQLQGEMAICGAPWCDFMVICNKTRTIALKRVFFQPRYWNHIASRLKQFCFAIEETEIMREVGRDMYSGAMTKRLRQVAVQDKPLPAEDVITVQNLLIQPLPGVYRGPSRKLLSFDILMGSSYSLPTALSRYEQDLLSKVDAEIKGKSPAGNQKNGSRAALKERGAFPCRRLFTEMEMRGPESPERVFGEAAGIFDSDPMDQSGDGGDGGRMEENVSGSAATASCELPAGMTSLEGDVIRTPQNKMQLLTKTRDSLTPSRTSNSSTSQTLPSTSSHSSTSRTTPSTSSNSSTPQASASMSSNAKMESSSSSFRRLARITATSREQQHNPVSSVARTPISGNRPRMSLPRSAPRGSLAGRNVAHNSPRGQAMIRRSLRAAKASSLPRSPPSGVAQSVNTGCKVQQPAAIGASTTSTVSSAITSRSAATALTTSTSGTSFTRGGRLVAKSPQANVKEAAINVRESSARGKTANKIFVAQRPQSSGVLSQGQTRITAAGRGRLETGSTEKQAGSKHTGSLDGESQSQSKDGQWGQRVLTSGSSFVPPGLTLLSSPSPAESAVTSSPSEPQRKIPTLLSAQARETASRPHTAHHQQQQQQATKRAHPPQISRASADSKKPMMSQDRSAIIAEDIARHQQNLLDDRGMSPDRMGMAVHRPWQNRGGEERERDRDITREREFHQHMAREGGARSGRPVDRVEMGLGHDRGQDMSHQRMQRFEEMAGARMQTAMERERVERERMERERKERERMERERVERERMERERVERERVERERMDRERVERERMERERRERVERERDRERAAMVQQTRIFDYDHQDQIVSEDLFQRPSLLSQRVGPGGQAAAARFEPMRRVPLDLSDQRRHQEISERELFLAERGRALEHGAGVEVGSWRGQLQRQFQQQQQSIHHQLQFQSELQSGFRNPLLWGATALQQQREAQRGTEMQGRILGRDPHPRMDFRGDPGQGQFPRGFHPGRRPHNF